MSQDLPISFSLVALKGGVGKTTLSYNFGCWLAKKYRVLFIDTDSQQNLQSRFNLPDTLHGTFADILLGKTDVKPVNVGKNIDLLPGSSKVDDVEQQIATEADKYYRLLKWITSNQDLISHYDYIVSDTHPGFNTSVANVVLMTDYIVSPITPNLDSYTSHVKLEKRLAKLRKQCSDPRTGTTYVTAKLVFVLNKMRKITDSSKAIAEQVSASGQDNFIATIPQKELLNKSSFLRQPVIDFDKTTKNQNKEFYKNLDNEFNKILHCK